MERKTIERKAHKVLELELDTAWTWIGEGYGPKAKKAEQRTEQKHA